MAFVFFAGLIKKKYPSYTLEFTKCGLPERKDMKCFLRIEITNQIKYCFPHLIYFQDLAKGKNLIYKKIIFQ